MLNSIICILLNDCETLSIIGTNAAGVNLEDLQKAEAAEALLSLKILSAANDQFKGVDLTSDYADDKTGKLF